MKCRLKDLSNCRLDVKLERIECWLIVLDTAIQIRAMSGAFRNIFKDILTTMF